MDKEVGWGSTHGEGDIFPTCKTCGKGRQLPDEGWVSRIINEEWHEFCCEKCRNDYIKKHG